MARSLRRRARDERGFTVIEITIASAILMLVTAPLLASLVTAQRVEGVGDTLSQAVAAARTGLDQLSREVREAKTLTAGGSANSAWAWYDKNNDGMQQSGEIVAYSITDIGPNYALVRVSFAGGRVLVDKLDASSTLTLSAGGAGTSMQISLAVDVDPSARPEITRIDTVVFARNGT